MSNPSPICTVNGSPAPGVVSASASVTIALESPAGAKFWSVSCTSTDETNTVGAINASLSINQTNKTATFTAPGLGSAAIFTSIVGILGPGLDANGQAQDSFRTTFKVNVLSAASTTVLAADEGAEQSAASGWIAVVNPVLRSGGGGGSSGPTLAGGSPSVAAGDTVVSANAAASSTVIRAQQSTVANAPIVAGIVLASASAGSQVLFAGPGTVVSSSITGLSSGIACKVAVQLGSGGSVADGRLYRVTEPTGAELIVGMSDGHGNVTVAPTSGVNTHPRHEVQVIGPPFFTPVSDGVNPPVDARPGITAALALAPNTLIRLPATGAGYVSFDSPLWINTDATSMQGQGSGAVPTGQITTIRAQYLGPLICVTGAYNPPPYFQNGNFYEVGLSSDVGPPNGAYLMLSETPAAQIGGFSQFSITMGINCRSVPGVGEVWVPISCEGTEGSSKSHITTLLAFDATLQPTFTLSLSGGDVSVGTTTALTLNSRVEVCFDYDGTWLRSFVNGAFQTKVAASGTVHQEVFENFVLGGAWSQYPWSNAINAAGDIRVSSVLVSKAAQHPSDSNYTPSTTEPTADGNNIFLFNFDPANRDRVFISAQCNGNNAGYSNTAIYMWHGIIESGASIEKVDIGHFGAVAYGPVVYAEWLNLGNIHDIAPQGKGAGVMLVDNDFTTIVRNIHSAIATITPGGYFSFQLALIGADSIMTIDAVQGNGGTWGIVCAGGSGGNVQNCYVGGVLEGRFFVNGIGSETGLTMIECALTDEGENTNDCAIRLYNVASFRQIGGNFQNGASGVGPAVVIDTGIGSYLFDGNLQGGIDGHGVIQFEGTRPDRPVMVRTYQPFGPHDFMGPAADATQGPVLFIDRQMITQSIAGLTTFAMPMNKALAANGFRFTGALTGDCTVTLPLDPTYLCWDFDIINATTGGHNVIVKSASGTGVTYSANGRCRSDGTNMAKVV